MTTPDEDEKWELSSVQRAFNILEIIDEYDGIEVSELAAKEDMPRSTAHIYLKSLSETGFVINDNGVYRLGFRFLEFGGRIRRKQKLYQIAKGEIKNLSERTGEVASLGIEEEGKRVLLDKSEGKNATYDKVPLGERTNLHWTALGKAILAFLPPERVDNIVEQHGLPAETERTITTKEELENELKTIRELGYALEDEDRKSGVRSIAIPIRSDNGSILGAVSLTGPKSRFTDSVIGNELVDDIQSAVNIIEIKYSHN